jgi:hypothetical protein
MKAQGRPLRAIAAAVQISHEGVEHADFDETPCATEWSGSSVINLGGLPGLVSYPTSINNAGQVVGSSEAATA